MDLFYIGVMSGTSLDGVDIALCSFGKTVELKCFESYLFDRVLRNNIIDSIQKTTTLKELGTLDYKLGEMYSKYINKFLAKNNLTANQIRAIGLHGQTIWHEPNEGFSMQLGNPSKVAIETNIAVVCDIRQMDIACGGQGAPFAPLFHKVLFAKKDQKIAVVNIGGMSNISIFGKEVIGYDTGCGNVLLDSWSEKYYNLSYDSNGDIARSGEIYRQLLDVMVGDDYFSKSHPKSTGREYFNLEWIGDKISQVDSLVDIKGERYFAKNVLRTLVELTAITIINEARKFDIDIIILSGGGVKNSFLVERLRSLFDGSVKFASDYGAPEDSIEAMMMAYFAYLRINKQKANLKNITGAKENFVAGALYEPN